MLDSLKACQQHLRLCLSLLAERPAALDEMEQEVFPSAQGLLATSSRDEEETAKCRVQTVCEQFANEEASIRHQACFHEQAAIQAY